MQPVEMIVFLTLSLIVALLVLHVVVGWDVTATYGWIRGLFGHDTKAGFAMVDTDGLVAESLALWQGCGMGDVDKSRVVFVDGSGVLSASDFFGRIKALNLCSSLQSATHDCGRRENVKFVADITLPHVVKLRCDAAQATLVIDGGP